MHHEQLQPPPGIQRTCVSESPEEEERQGDTQRQRSIGMIPHQPAPHDRDDTVSIERQQRQTSEPPAAPMSRPRFSKRLEEPFGQGRARLHHRSRQHSGVEEHTEQPSSISTA